MNTDILFLILMLIVFANAMVLSLWILCKNPRRGEDTEVRGYAFAAISEIGKREEQQDSVWFSGMPEMVGQIAQNCASQGAISQARMQVEDDCLAVVADGMGGLKNGGVISEMIAVQMKNAFFATDRPEEPIPFLQNALWKVNESVNAYLDTCGNENGGSTVVAAYIREQKLYFLSVGDSRIYLVHEKMISKLNMEHNFGNELDDLAMRGIISIEEAKKNRQRAALTSYVGMGDITKVDGNVEPIPLKRGDVVLLMSDGVFGTINDQEILDCVEERKDATEDAAAGIVLRIREKVAACGKMKQDNYSVVAIRVL